MKKTVNLDEEIWTYEDYLKLPPDGKTYQIIGGKLFMAPAPTPYHQKVSRNLEFILWSWVKENNLGEVLYAPVDVVFSSVNVVQPDIIFISKNKIEILKERGIFGAPDLIVEIISPSTSELDIKLKNREKKIQVYQLKGGTYRLKGVFLGEDIIRSELIKGLEINLKEVF